jgi:hypothetical protein
MRRVARERLGVRLDFLGSSPVPVTDHLADALMQRLPPPGPDGPNDPAARSALPWASGPEVLDSVL